MPARIHRLNFLQAFGVRLGIWGFRLLALMVRVELTPRAREIIEALPRSHLFLLWHNRLALALMTLLRINRKRKDLCLRGLELTGLVSTSNDGAFLEAVMHAFGVKTVRGSSSRRSVEATRELIEALGAGCNIVITPDGPRGPLYSVKDGAAVLARDYAAGALGVGLNVSRFWQFRSWDRFILPKPFSTITMDLQRIELHEAGAPITKEQIQEMLRAANR